MDTMVCATVEREMPVIDVDLLPLSEVPHLDRLWTDLEARADGSFFLSWLWVSCWLEHLPSGSRPFVLVARSGERVVGLAILCRATVWRYGLLRKRCWLLHETGDRVFDRLTVEYNGILADEGCREVVWTVFLDWLARNVGDWDEMVLSGISPDFETAVRSRAVSGGHLVHVRRAETAKGVDLARVRRDGGEYRAGLGRNTRSAVRRAERLYDERGGIAFEIATTADEALGYFEDMEALHQAAWKARGKYGAFDNPVFRPFHRRLIERATSSGQVRLCRITAGGRPIGYLYNFVSGNRVLNYQSGFAYESDNRLKPGLLSHVLAVEDALARGEAYYDFLAGSSGHKQHLSNDRQRLNWISVEPDGMLGRVDAALGALRGRLTALRRSASATLSDVKARR
ncbi:GNAT family N-acetyltransferase [Arenibaculum sp.]|jgi:CelD/BcsL family acetyltransferase involved in cellulose biosynthesis|uniref:GNAT family N-acetyltransferase n=1 Tax=Arenibaculum sp. TaxID=2865862 RepID=UPI002E116969|nr:GNAT family N-acetyltransferase [Arenibaculum sp.]